MRRTTTDLDFKRRPQTAGEEDCHPSGQDTAAVHDNEQTFRFDPSLMRIIWEV
jgi:hypothetical protein